MCDIANVYADTNDNEGGLTTLLYSQHNLQTEDRVTLNVLKSCCSHKILLKLCLKGGKSYYKSFKHFQSTVSVIIFYLKCDQIN